MTGTFINSSLPTVPTMAVFGATGFIGANLLSGLRRVNPNCIGFSRQYRDELLHLDLKKPEIGPLKLKTRGITHAILATGISGVAECELEPAASRTVNVKGTVELARQLNDEGIRVAALSSDYVFDGIEGDYNEFSPVNPLNEYGRQKVEMEQRLSIACRRNALIIRLSKVFDANSGSGTLLDEMAGKLLQGIPLQAARDQYFCPTFLDDVVALVLELIATNMTGIVHLCSPAKTNRLDLAIKVAASFGCDRDLIQDISLRDLGETFTRPLDTSMLCHRLAGTTRHRFRSLNICVDDLKESYDARYGLITSRVQTVSPSH